MQRVALLVSLVGCGRSSELPPSNRGSTDVAPVEQQPDLFEGTISGHHFTIKIDGGKLANADRSTYTWNVGGGRLVVADSGPVAEETQNLVARSPRTIVRDSDGLWIVTEVVTIAGGRAFTCLHQQTVSKDGSAEAKQAAARGVAACTSLRVE